MSIHVTNSIVELMKVLPTRDFEFNFLADFFMILNQIFASYKRLDYQKNLELFLSKVLDAFKFHTLPYIIEIGSSILK